MAEALEQVKRTFGRDAVILNTRTLTKGGLFGLGGNPRVEITAAQGETALPSMARRGMVPVQSKRTQPADGAATMMSPVAPRADRPPSDALVSEIGAMKSLVQDLVRDTRSARWGDTPGELYDTYRRLVGNAVAEEIAQQLVERGRSELTPAQLADPKAVRAHLAAVIESMLPTAGPIRVAPAGRPKLIALIGPTGVGKTTTIAKLAANFCLREQRKVGLITIDTYRIAAVEQLRTYAQIIDVPLEVVMTPGELRDAVDRSADRDIVFIDTAGRSQRDSVKTGELKKYFEAVRPDEIHLVLSSTCSEAVLAQTIHKFREVGVDRIIFTKLDEAIGFGVMLSCLQKAQARLSYVTTGQDVPDDIRVGDGKAIARLIVGERSSRLEPCATAVSAVTGVPRPCRQ